jgi:PKD repeat protein
MAQNAPQDGSTGVVWNGSPGVTETVSQIMARQKSLPPKANAAARETHPRLVTPGSVKKDGGDDDITTVFLPAGKYVNQPANGALLPQTVGTGFLGAQISDTIGYIPPDSMGTVGPSQILVVVNGRIKVFDKSGNLGPLNTDTDSFFGSVESASTSDPHARYDRLSGRWFISMIDVATINRVLLAVSSGPTITSSSSFTFFQFQHDLVGPVTNFDTGQFADYDTLGVDANAVYIGVNIFNSAGTAFLSTTGFVIRKSDLLSGTLTVTAFRHMATATSAGPSIIPQGVNNDDPNATQGYFIAVDPNSTTNLALYRVSNPGGTPSLSTNLVSVPAFDSPIQQVHKGDTLGRKLDAIDTRLFGAQINKNQLTGVSSLWTAHNIAVNSSGNPSTHGPRNASRWYEIRNLTSTPSAFQSGVLFDSATSNPRGFWMPSVAMNGQGHMALGCSYASVNDFAGVAVAGRLSGDPTGTIQSPTLAVVSSTAYNINEPFQNFTSPHRWGDFSQVSVDPTDDMTMWTFQEYCNANNSWGVQAIQLNAPPPATPSKATPPSLNAGQTSVNVVITGTTNSGSAFFDPGPDTGGPGFANHIAATVNGGGVTVNSVTFSNSTNITLNVTVAANATGGARTVTVTNPDGQAQTSASGILTITANPVAPSISVQPASRTNVAGTTATFSVTASGSPAPAYQWVKNTITVLTNGGNISGVTTSNLTIVNVGAGDAAGYTVVITNSVGSVTSSVATLTVLIPPVATFSAQPTNGSVPLLVTFTNSSTGATNYSWTFGDGHTSTSAQPVNTYTNAGTFTVSLTANGPGGTSTLTRTNYILVTNPPPVVAFSASPTNGPAPLTVTFTNQTTGATNFNWTFGDGHTSTNTQPVNTYTNAGIYTVSLLATGPGGSVSLTRTNFAVVTNPPPAVAFSANPTNGPAPLTVTFSNLTTGAVTNYAWDFGDGRTSTNAQPTNTYTNAGTYTVSLVANGPGGSSSLTRTNFILVTNPPPAVAFTANPTNGVVPLTVNFTNLTIGATNYTWDFGDGHSSTNFQPVNTYSNVGLYTVSLVADGPGGISSLTHTNFILVTNPPPTVAFTANPTNGSAPLTVNFTNLTVGATNYSWDFGDGHSSTNVQSVNTYTNAGTYTVSLVADGPGGVTSLTHTNFILVTNPPPTVAFTANPTNGSAPLTVNFTNLTVGATNYAWDFGDGHTSTNAQPANTYTNAGLYTVSLVADGPGGVSSLNYTNLILVTNPPPAVSFVANPTNGYAPLIVTFSNLTTGASVYAWDFGDGHASTNAQPATTYTNAGTYTVSLLATGPGGSSTLIQSNYIEVLNPPPILLTISLSAGTVTLSWNSIPARTYRVQLKESLDDALWTNLVPDVPASGSTASTTDTVGEVTHKFYRVMLLPGP